MLLRKKMVGHQEAQGQDTKAEGVMVVAVDNIIMEVAGAVEATMEANGINLLLMVLITISLPQ